MCKLTIFTLIAATLAGCASGPPPALYGNFVKVAVPANDKMMAHDAAKKMAALYPPARTRINLQQATPDAFGTTLVAALRTKGYALAEIKNAQATAPHQADELAVAYVVDQPLEASLYRVTLLINSQSLSRLYQVKDGAIAPAGYWIRKE